MDDFELKNNKIVHTKDMAIFSGNNVNNGSEELKEKIKSLRARLLVLFTEQQNWQKQLQEVGKNMSFDEVRNQIKQANDRIKKHQEIIVKCEEWERKQGKHVSIMVPIEEADSEYTIDKVVYWGGEPSGVDNFYSVEHSQNRIVFWNDEIAKYEQKLQMMEIAQQQLTQVRMEIADVNEQIKNVTTSLASEPLVAERSNKIGNVSIPENNKVSEEWIYTENATSEEINTFEGYIKCLCEKKVSAKCIKEYIKGKEKDRILVHIEYKKQYKILEEIGVNFTEKTYLNA